MATADLTTAPPRPAALGPLELTPEEKRHLLATAAELVRAAATGRTANFADPTFGGLADRVVAGVFVSLKRAGHLRGCCGMLGQAVPLAKALGDAAERTVWEDARFPPVSATELEHLEMEVWLLGPTERVGARGEERLHAVTVGLHGLVIERDQARGLLLPGVPVDHGWDAQRFLEQVCTKAGLHPTLWKDDDSSLFTFEGRSVCGRVLDPPPEGTPRPAAWFTPEQLAAYADFCRGNIAALLTGATPNYYLFGASDGTVSGLVLSVRRPGETEGHTLSQISTRPGVPLQSSLFALSQAAAQSLARQGITAQELAGLQVDVTVLYDPAMHGTVGGPHLAGIEPRFRGVLVLERARAGLVFDPQRTPEELVSLAAEQARVRQPAGASVFSLETLTTGPRVVVSAGPRPVRGPATRPPGVAGRFYPAAPAGLAKLVDRLLDDSSLPPEGGGSPEAWSAALVPHAGLAYSGRVAASVLKRIRIPRTVIVLGPKHTPHGMEWAIAPQQTWAMPGFTVESDPKLARQLSQAIPGLELDALAHRDEHAIEVELPFLARLAPEAHVVGIALGGSDLDGCLAFAERLAAFLAGRPDRPLLLISSDMNHFATDAENRRLDAIAMTALERLDPRALYETVTGNHISMCGLVPAVIVLETLRLLGGLRRAERVAYATSADVSGDTSRVVGYAGMLFGA
jgi:AmmeMemoRadiSam system protein B/AmmeMemoRadiSam system protein A